VDGSGGRQGAWKVAGHTGDPAGAVERICRVARKAQAVQFAAMARESAAF
jgi:hypothetical protein